MTVTATTHAGVNVWQFSGVVTDAQIKSAWAASITGGVYIPARAIYLDSTADLTQCRGGFLVDFGTQVDPAIILHASRDKTKSTFTNWTFFQRTGLAVGSRDRLVKSTDGTTITTINAQKQDGLSMKGGAFVYAVAGNPGGGDPRYLLECAFASLDGTTLMSQQFTEQELQPCMYSSVQLKGVSFQKCFGFPQIENSGIASNINITVYRSSLNTEHATQQVIRVYPTYLNYYASVCYVDSAVTRQGADVSSNLIDSYGSTATRPVTIVVLNNYQSNGWFGTSKTTIPALSWVAENRVIGGVLKKFQFINGANAVVKMYDSRSTTAPQKCKFVETGFNDFLDTNTSPAADASGKISVVAVGAIATGVTAAITRYTGQKYTVQKFGYGVQVNSISMTSGDNDLSAYAPVALVPLSYLHRTQAQINSATIVSDLNQLAEEIHNCSVGLSGDVSYAGQFNGNLHQAIGSSLDLGTASVRFGAGVSPKFAYDSFTNRFTAKTPAIFSAGVDIKTIAASSIVIDVGTVVTADMVVSIGLGAASESIGGSVTMSPSAQWEILGNPDVMPASYFPASSSLIFSNETAGKIVDCRRCVFESGSYVGNLGSEPITLRMNASQAQPDVDISVTIDTTSYCTVSISNLVPNSRIKAVKVSDGAVLFNGGSATSDISFQTDYIGALAITARKATTAPYYKEWVTQINTVADGVVSVAALQDLDE